MVNELKAAYENLSFDKRRDILIPASAEFLLDACIVKAPGKYDFRYKWPANKPNEVCDLSKGDIIDRIGDVHGRYVCPLNNDKKSFSIEERSLPYYFSEQEIQNITASPSYHRYKIIAEISSCKKGRTRKAFEQCGGADEIKFDKDIYVLLQNKLVEELIYAKR